MILKFIGANPKSSKVKTYDNSTFYFGVMMWAKMYIKIDECIFEEYQILIDCYLLVRFLRRLGNYHLDSK